MSCCFHLVGFEDEHISNPSGDSSLGCNGNDDKQELLRLIRRGAGTVFWDVHESITHMIVASGSDAKLR